MSLKWLLGISAVIAAAGAAAFVWLPPLENKPEIPAPSGADISNAARALIAKEVALQGYKIDAFLTGEHPAEGTWAVRGSLAGNDRIGLNTFGALPFYGKVSTACDSWSETRCWRLTGLVIDGVKRVIASEPEPSGQPGPELNSSGPESEPENKPVKSVPGTTVPPESKQLLREATAPARGPAPANGISRRDRIEFKTAKPTRESKGKTVRLQLEPVQKAKDSVAEKITEKPDADRWNTVIDNVNARSGPGTKYKVHFKMPKNIGLRLLKTEDGWGHFEYAGSNGTSGRVWISMKLVKRAAKSPKS